MRLHILQLAARKKKNSDGIESNGQNHCSSSRNARQWVGGIAANRQASARSGLFAAIALAAALLLGICPASAQQDQGTVTGVVKDASGAVVPNAQVTLTELDNGLVLQRKSNSSGIYVFQPVKIGHYSVSATYTGFETTVNSDLHLNVNERLNVDLVLKAGGASETVQVTGAAPILQTEQASVDQTFSSRTINDVPLNGRNWIYIAQLSAGVVQNVSSGNRLNQGDFDANGQRATENNFILDGVDNNINVVDYLNGTTYAVRPPPDAMAEFKIQTNSYSAEFGHSAGAVINASVKSGTNQIHGDLWEYNRNSGYDVKEYFTPVSPYHQNQFGATLGFPVVRNHLFIFGDVEATRILFSQPDDGLSIPTAKMRVGDFTELFNPTLAEVSPSVEPWNIYVASSAGTIPINCNGQQNVFQTGTGPGCVTPNPTALKILALFPLPNTNGGKIYNNYNTLRPISNNNVVWNTRIDWNATPRDQAFVRLSYENNPQYYSPPLGPILDGGGFGNDGTQLLLAENIAASETHTFSPSIINEARFGYNYSHPDDFQASANTNSAASLGLGGIPYEPGQGGIPEIDFGDGDTSIGPPAYYATSEHEYVWQALDNLTVIRGNQSLKFGINYDHIRVTTLQPTYPRGHYWFSDYFTQDPFRGPQYSGFSYADMLSDDPTNAALSNTFPTDSVRPDIGIYGEDDWKVNDRLTLNLGLRWEDIEPAIDRHDDQANFYPIAGSYQVAANAQGRSSGRGVYVLPASKQGVSLPTFFTNLLTKDNIALQYSNNRELVTHSKLGFAPRLGASYKVDPRTVARMGFGIFYGGLESTGYNNSPGANFPFQITPFFNQPPGNPCTQGPPAYCPGDGLNLETGFSNILAVGLLNYAGSTPQLNGTEPNQPTAYSIQYNLSLEHQLNGSTVATISYVGNVGRHLPVIENVNAPLAVSLFYQNNLQPFPDFGGTGYLAHVASSSYNSLQAKLERRFSSGLSYIATYTYSKSLDDGQSPLGDANNGGYRNVNIIPPGGDYAPSSFDTRHRATLFVDYELPVGHGRRFLNHGGPADWVLGGWSSSLTWRVQTGTPFSVGPGTNYVGGGNAFAYPARNPFKAGGVPAGVPGITTSLSGASDCAPKTRVLANWYNPCAFVDPPSRQSVFGNDNTKLLTGAAAAAVLGDHGNNVYGPGYNQTDASLFKSFKTFREQSLQLRIDAFNVMNTPSWAQPCNTGDNSSSSGSICALRYFQQYAPDSRFFQFAGKYYF